MKNDEELMIEYKQGNTAILEDIFARYKNRMFNYALRLMNNRADAEEIVGEIFYILTTHKDNYEPKAKFSTWLYTIAHNVCVDRLRKRKRVVFMWFKKDRESNEYEQLEIPDTKDLPGESAQKKDSVFYIKRAINRLPVLQKEALILREYQRLNYEEISEVLNCTVSNVKILLFRARNRLKKQLLPLIEEASNA